MTTRKSEARDATQNFSERKEYIGRLINILEGLVDELNLESGKSKHWGHVGDLNNAISKLEDSILTLGSSVRKFDTKGDAWSFIDKILAKNQFYSRAVGAWVTIPKDD